MCVESCFFFNDTATAEISTLSLHVALPISALTAPAAARVLAALLRRGVARPGVRVGDRSRAALAHRSEEHTSELPRQYLVCRLLLEKKKIAPFPYLLPVSRRSRASCDVTVP